MMTSREIRQSFLDFFRSKGHTIVPSAPVIPHGDPTLLFTNAGMNQFKDVFLGTGRREYVRAADTQKCIRASGKHNDLEDVGRDTYHHTFFEMLGNWSFGDYYKHEAIAWAWELLTGVWGLEKGRLYATVFETDEQAEKLWKTVTDINPNHVLRFGKKDNFWEMGETGPCGPCSEIHIDLTPDGSGRSLVNAGDGHVMEIWNLVFIQNNRTAEGTLEELPARHVDTGMGFERMCAVLQGKHSNYDTDVFTPLIDAIARTTGRSYTAETDRIAMRVIADHIRMLSFAIADGAIPGNDGRGYVLRRILRRAARFGRSLGMRDPFIHALASVVAESMGDVFPEVPQHLNHIQSLIRTEEESFNTTLDRGLEIFESVLARIGDVPVFPGEDAFRLYDTFGFPVDLTQMMAQERGRTVDTAGFDILMREQQERARRSDKMKSAITSSRLSEELGELPVSTFVGYETLETPAVLEKVIDGRFVGLDRTPFYVESGGQVDDTGMIEGPGFSAEVLDSLRIDDRILHEVHLVRGSLSAEGSRHVTARVDRARRENIQRNHSATHLVHEALRRVLGAHVHQQGSLVAPDHLRFDFPHRGKITPEEIRAIEDLVNARIAENIPVHTEIDLPIEKARKIPNVKMFFGDKYGEKVRVVFIDEAYSVEFCGGTHVRSTRDIGLFKIISESGIASGVRRIEAVTGDGLRAYIERQIARAGQMNQQIADLIDEQRILEKDLGRASSPAPAFPPLAFPGGEIDRRTLDDISAALRDRESAIELIGRRALELRKDIAKGRIAHGTSSLEALIASGSAVNGLIVVAARVDAASMDELKSLGDALRAKLKSGVGILATVIEEKAALVCVVTDDLVAGGRLQAGKIIGAVAKQVGGAGGGRPHMATAGGKDVAKLDTALRSASDIVRALLG
ncbi:MAG TPA: alanine--tRNA ligase [Bacteroidota bacterium]|nr:alanine--tRNA ligase [Bacteroidota bacterium]